MKAHQIVPNLWFDTQAEEAAEFYCSIFPDSRIVGKTHYPEASDRHGQVVTVDWEMNGQRFTGINGGPEFKFDEAISFLIECDDQEDLDRHWDALLADGGQESMCGWLKDRFGVSWQVVPAGMDDLFAGEDPERVNRAWKAMMEMRKLDIAALRAAADGEG
jgi:predicted 3-demethylubiquinone-9 3-methyltransferase (glyoxalase superfamily)